MQSRFEQASVTGGGQSLSGPGAALAGIEWLRAAMRGDLPAPPLVLELGIRLIQVDEGLVVGSYMPHPRHLNGLDTVHGGVLATIADTVGSCAILTVMPAGIVTPTLEMKINFLRPVSHDSGAVRAEGRLISRGRTTALAEARVTDAVDRPVAHATVTCSLVAIDSGRAQ